MSFAYYVNKMNASPTWTSLNIHAFFSTTVTYHLIRGTHANLWWVLGVWTLITAWKEFWWDMKYEVPPQKVRGSAIDFAGYAAGSLMTIWFTLAGI